MEPAFEDFEVQLVLAVTKDDLRPGFELLPGVHQAIPLLVAEPAQQQALDVAPTGNPATQEARRIHTRVVDHQQITRTQESGQVEDMVVGVLSERPIEVQQPRLFATGNRRLRDQLRGKVVVEIGERGGQDRIRTPSAGGPRRP